jgi:RNA-directed DNA polymerase
VEHWDGTDEAMDAIKTKPYEIDKKLVYDAYKAVKTNAGAAGVDGLSLEQFAQDLKRSFYKVWNRMSSGGYFPRIVQKVRSPVK